MTLRARSRQLVELAPRLEVLAHCAEWDAAIARLPSGLAQKLKCFLGTIRPDGIRVVRSAEHDRCDYGAEIEFEFFVRRERNPYSYRMIVSRP